MQLELNDMVVSRTKWFQDARFGLFLHWGLYCVPGGEWRGQRMEYIGEWIQSKFKIPNNEYSKLTTVFNPTAFNADEWVQLAKQAGMRYIVFTAKHHEGFAMYHSRCSPFNIVDATPLGRDPLRELADACALHRMTLGVYYSQSLDWHEADAGGTEQNNPLNNGMSWGNNWDFPSHSLKDFSRYFEAKVKPQVHELLTEYGPIGVFWFDTPFTLTVDQSRELWELVRELQPDCIVNSRLGHEMGDFHSMGDNQMPAGPVNGVWEAPATLNDTWGYKSFDNNWKSARDVLATLISLASKNVNYLLNIGPTPKGVFPAPAVEILKEIGGWMAVNREAIQGVRESPFPYDFPWGWITHKPGRLYLHLYAPPTKDLTLHGLRNAVKRAYILDNRSMLLPYVESHDAERDMHLLTLKMQTPSTESMIPVVVVEYVGKIDVQNECVQQGDGSILLPAHLASVETPGEVGPQLDQSSILVNWRDERDWVHWNFQVYEPRDFEVSIITSARHHNALWHGGHLAVVEVAGQALATELHEDKRLETPGTHCYTQALSQCGEARISEPGHCSLSLKMEKIDNRSGDGVALVSVLLTPIKAKGKGRNG